MSDMTGSRRASTRATRSSSRSAAAVVAVDVAGDGRHALGPHAELLADREPRIAPRPDRRRSRAGRRRSRSRRASNASQRPGPASATASSQPSGAANVTTMPSCGVVRRRHVDAGRSDDIGRQRRDARRRAGYGEAVVRERVALGLPLAEQLARQLREHLERAGAAVPGDAAALPARLAVPARELDERHVGLGRRSAARPDRDLGFLPATVAVVVVAVEGGVGMVRRPVAGRAEATAAVVDLVRVAQARLQVAREAAPLGARPLGGRAHDERVAGDEVLAELDRRRRERRGPGGAADAGRARDLHRSACPRSDRHDRGPRQERDRGERRRSVRRRVTGSRRPVRPRGRG